MTDSNKSTLQIAFKKFHIKEQIVIDWKNNEDLKDFKETLLDQGFSPNVTKAFFVGSHIGGEHRKSLKEYQQMEQNGTDISLPFE